MPILLRLICIWIAAAAAVGAAPAPAPAAGLKVVASFAAMRCLAANVAGDAAEVTSLVPAGMGPHDFSLRPSDARRLAEADVVVVNGLGLEEWLEETLASVARSGVKVVEASAGIEGLAWKGGEEGRADDDEDDDAHGNADGAGHGHAHDHGERSGEINPHVWLDPLRAIRQVENIRDALAGADAARADVYRANAAAYVARLRALHEEIAGRLAAFSGARIVTSHDAADYFAARYGLRVVGVLRAEAGREPTPRYLKRLRESVARDGVAGMFAEPLAPARLLEQLAAEAGVRVGVFDPMESGTDEPGMYEAVMRANAESVARVLGGG